MISSVAPQPAVTPSQQLIPEGAAVAKPGDAGFGQVLASLPGQAVSSLRGAESVAISSIRGDASLRQTIDAILAAERNLQTVIAVRDKLVAAYSEISRMQI